MAPWPSPKPLQLHPRGRRQLVKPPGQDRHRLLSVRSFCIQVLGGYQRARASLMMRAWLLSVNRNSARAASSGLSHRSSSATCTRRFCSAGVFTNGVSASRDR
jgi:hypothetical protein